MKTLFFLIVFLFASVASAQSYVIVAPPVVVQPPVVIPAPVIVQPAPVLLQPTVKTKYMPWRIWRPFTPAHVRVRVGF